MPAPPSSSGSAPSTPLNVIGLISGGKDSFFGLLHCLAHGHRVVALANLHPGVPDDRGGQAQTQAQDHGQEDEEDEDYDSFMYQTVGHQVVPLYAAATGLPLYRQKILGHAVHSGRDYHAPTPQTEVDSDSPDQSGDSQPDETESMTRLLRRVRAAHPEANAVCAGALLSTYQRTRVESVAVRLGLVSLAYLWKYPLLPFGGGPATDSSSDYLSDLAAAGFDARIVKVASGGLDDTLLWTNVASAAGRTRLQRALARFGQLSGGGGGDGENSVGSLLGEGGEYETLVVDGPPVLFRGGSLCVAPEDRRIVHEGGGSAWLQIRRATVQSRGVEADAADAAAHVRQPDVLDRRFAAVLKSLGQQQGGGQEKSEDEKGGAAEEPRRGDTFAASSPAANRPVRLSTWRVVPERSPSSSSMTVAEATRSIVDQVRRRLDPPASSPSPSLTSKIDRTLVVLRRMADFPAFNAVYGTLFADAPNPPARVTIACGDHMPAGVDVAVHFSVLDDSKVVGADRHGLHVQSRSYWAPANIGPYSQAVHLPLAQLQHLSREDARSAKDDGDADAHAQAGNGPRLVSIAGQIPLFPATMELPDGSVEASEKDKALQDALPEAPPLLRHGLAEKPASFGFQTTLALQHLWRIGLEVDVQWWTGAVAYVPRPDKNESDADLPLLSLADKAALIARAWHTAHTWRPQEQDEDDDSGPDLWDRRFNAQYAGYGATGDDVVDIASRLPDWSVLRNGPTLEDSGHGAQPQQLEDARPFVPPVFLAEIHELPRAAPVEWHALAGLSHLPAGSLTLGPVVTAQGGGRSTEYRTVVSLTKEATTRGASPSIVQTIRTWPHPTAEAEKAHTANRPLSATLLEHFPATAAQAPDVVYVDANVYGDGQIDGVVAAVSAPGLIAALPVVPCESLWNEHGAQLAAVAVWTTVQELAAEQTANTVC